LKGNIEVWHGSVDVIINEDLIVEHLEDPLIDHEEKENSPEGQSPLKVKLNSSVLSRSPQITAKTIVFSFLQKKIRPKREHFLTPCIVVGNSSIAVMFYDSEHDVLLESVHIPLFHASSSGEYEFNDVVILVSWLVVNYRYLCSGLTDDMKSFKGDFPLTAKEKLKIYEESLQFGIIPHPLQNIPRKSLQCSSFLEEQEIRLVKVIHRELRDHGAVDEAMD
jgi:hypothetical protein